MLNPILQCTCKEGFRGYNNGPRIQLQVACIDSVSMQRKHPKSARSLKLGSALRDMQSVSTLRGAGLNTPGGAKSRACLDSCITCQGLSPGAIDCTTCQRLSAGLTKNHIRFLTRDPCMCGAIAPSALARSCGDRHDIRHMGRKCKAASLPRCESGDLGFRKARTSPLRPQLTIERSNLLCRGRARQALL